MRIERLAAALVLGCLVFVGLAFVLAHYAFAQSAADIAGAVCSDAARPYLIMALGVVISANVLAWAEKRVAALPHWAQAFIRFGALHWPTAVKLLTRTAPALLIAIMITGCAALGLKSWDNSQIAYFELVAATAAENVALQVEKAPGLSAKDIAAVRTGGQSVSAAIQAQVAVLQNKGSTASQLEAAGLSGLVPAINNLGKILTASGGSTVSPQTLLLLGGQAQIEQLPALIGVVTELNNGYEPSAADFTAATANLTAAAAKL